MSTSDLQTAGGSYVTPSLRHARVSDAMRPGVITCPPDSSMRDVARMMVTNHIHAAVGAASRTAELGRRDRPRLCGRGRRRGRGGRRLPEVLVTVAPDEPLEAACELMRAHGSHTSWSSTRSRTSRWASSQRSMWPA